MRADIPVDDPRDECVYHQFVMYASNRNAVVSQLNARGIETVVHYPRPVHLQPAYSSIGYPPGNVSSRRARLRTSVELADFPGLSAEQIAFVADSVREVVGEK